MALYAANGSIRVTEVSGLAVTGLYAADGSWNVVESLDTVFVGSTHPCGALWVTVVTSDTQKGVYAPDGSLYVSLTPFTYKAGIRVTDVSGTLGSVAGGPLADFSDETNSMYIFILEDF